MSIYDVTQPFSGKFYFSKVSESPDPTMLIVNAGHEKIKPFLSYSIFEGYKYVRLKSNSAISVFKKI